MSDTGSAPGVTPGATPGERLRAEREKKGFSTQKVAEDLHVDLWIVEALESGRYESLGAPVYVKGHLRKYAALLGLDAEPLLAVCLEQVQPVPPPAPLKPTGGTMLQKPKRGLDLLWVLVVVAVVAAGWWGYRAWKAAAPSATPAPQTMTPAPEAAPAVEAPVDGEPAVLPAPPPELAKPPVPEAAPAAMKTPAPAANVARLRLTFAANSWLEVYDANGRRIAFEEVPADAVRSFAVAAPMRVFLGYAEGVQVEIDGRPVTVPGEARRGDIAHFMLDARGQPRPAGSLAR